jgi:hypothetical protein
VRPHPLATFPLSDARDVVRAAASARASPRASRWVFFSRSASAISSSRMIHSIVAGRRVARIAPASARCFDRAAASSRASDDRPRRPSAPRSIRARDRSLDDPSPSFRPDATLDALLHAANKR